MARGIVRCGSRASSRNTAVASNPMKLAIANMIAMPTAPEKIWPGSNAAVESPSGPPPWTITTTSSTTTIAISASSSTPSTRLESSMWR